MADIPHAVRQQIGSWYIVGTYHDSPGEDRPVSILAGPFLTVTESERLVPATASLYALLSGDATPVSEFGMALIEEPLDVPPRFNALLGLGDSGAPLSPEVFEETLAILNARAVTQEPEWYTAFDLSDSLTRAIRQRSAQTLSRYPDVESLLQALVRGLSAVSPLDIDLLLASGLQIPAPILQTLFQQRILDFLDHEH